MNLDGVTIEDQINNEQGPGPEMGPEVGSESPPSQSGFTSFFETLKDLLLRPTGPNEIGDYVDHPLNFDGSRGLAQILRGVAGFFGPTLGDLKLAIIDVTMGWWRWKRERVAGGQ